MTISIKRLSSRHTENLVRLWNKVLPIDAITLDTFESKVILDENFDANTCLVAEEGDELVGFAIGTHARRVVLGDHDPKGERAWITSFVVEPSRQQQGIGERIVLELLDIFVSLGKRECYISTYAPGYFTPGIDAKEYSVAVEFLKRLGFEETARPLSMDSSIVLFKVPPEVDEKESALSQSGISVRPYERAFLLPFLRFMENEMPFDWQRTSRLNLRDIARGLFQCDQIFIAANRDEVVGYCQYEGSHFGPFGVSKKFKGIGIGTVLLARTLERMRSKGHHDAWVMWTDDVAAKVYQKFGFKETRRFVVLRKLL
jgi:GNAT superfamily N-acetyltransferase